MNVVLTIMSLLAGAGLSASVFLYFELRRWQAMYDDLLLSLDGPDEDDDDDEDDHPWMGHPYEPAVRVPSLRN